MLITNFLGIPGWRSRMGNSVPYTNEAVQYIPGQIPYQADDNNWYLDDKLGTEIREVQEGSCYEFTALGQYIRTDTPVFTVNFTFEFDVVFNSDETVVLLGTYDGAQTLTGFEVWKNADNEIGFFIDGVSALGTETVITNKLYHIKIVRLNDVWVMTLNNEPYLTTTNDGPGYLANRFVIGGQFNNPALTFPALALIANVKIFDGDGDITHFWELQETVLDKAYDSVGGVDGTIEGTPTFPVDNRFLNRKNKYGYGINSKDVHIPLGINADGSSTGIPVATYKTVYNKRAKLLKQVVGSRYLSFDGASTHQIQLPYNIINGETSVTNFSFILEMDNFEPAGKEYFIGKYKSTTNERTFSFVIQADNQLQIGMSDDGGLPTFITVKTMTVEERANFKQFIVTFNSGLLKVWIDGVLEYSNTLIYTYFFASEVPFTIGGIFGSTSYHLQIDIHKFISFNETLDDSIITEYIASGDINIDNASGNYLIASGDSNIYDTSGNGNHGIVDAHSYDMWKTDDTTVRPSNLLDGFNQPQYGDFSIGAVYGDTGIYLSDNEFIIECDFTPVTAVGAHNAIFTNRQGSASYPGINIMPIKDNDSLDSISFSMYNKRLNLNSAYVGFGPYPHRVNQRVSIKLIYNGSSLVIETTIDKLTYTETITSALEPFDTMLQLGLFYRNVTSLNSKSKLYSFKVWNDGNLEVDYDFTTNKKENLLEDLSGNDNDVVFTGYDNNFFAMDDETIPADPTNTGFDVEGNTLTNPAGKFNNGAENKQKQVSICPDLLIPDAQQSNFYYKTEVPNEITYDDMVNIYDIDDAHLGFRNAEIKKLRDDVQFSRVMTAEEIIKINKFTKKPE